MIRRLLGGHDHVLVVRKHDDFFRIRPFDRLDQVRGRWIHRVSAVDDVRTGALEECAVAGTRGDGDDRGRPAAGRDDVQQAVLALLRLLVHVRDLDAADRAAGDAERQSAPGSSVCTCTLSAVRSPTTSSESPNSSS